MWQASRRFLTVHSYPRHLRTRECPYHPFSIVIAHGTQKCVKSSRGRTTAFGTHKCRTPRLTIAGHQTNWEPDGHSLIS